VSPQGRAIRFAAVNRERYEEVLFQGHPSCLSTPSVYVRGLITALAFGVIGGLASAIAAHDGHVQTIWVVIAVALVFARVSLKTAARCARTTYTITDRRLTVRTGLISRNVHETRLEHILDVNARQTLLERLLRIGTLEFDTAAGDDHAFALCGITEPRELAREIAGVLQQLR
jgi:uncharacterized membrane protein YdbT with pleckstrin-like domain